jgi:hypothetical protein
MSCSNPRNKSVPAPAPSVYYWKTVFKLDNTELNFLNQHAIKKIYLRFFDVDFDKTHHPIPIGTVQFESKIPKGIKIIPVVYIENHCLQQPEVLAQHIAKRVLTMAATNNIGIDELQIDCDWTNTSRATFFQLLKDIKKQLKTQGNYLLSATIRLHQLTQPVPPVDYGVLMCYNTGDLHDYNATSSILDVKDVAQFAGKHLTSYSLPLCGAYPIFSWNLLFEQKTFRTILREADLTDSTLYQQITPTHYRVVRSHSIPVPDPQSFGMMVRAGDEIKVDEVSAKTILNVQSMLEKRRPDINRQVVLFSLNSINNNKITSHEMDQIYRH